MAATHDSTPAQARQALVERIRADQAFAEQLIVDPARALAELEPEVLFGALGDDEVQGYAKPLTRHMWTVPFC